MNSRAILFGVLLGIFLYCAISVFSPAVSAQDAQSASHQLAAEMADALLKADVHTVAVFDFGGPATKLTAFGQDLASKLSVTMLTQSSNLSVLDRAVVQRLVEDNRLAPNIVTNRDVAFWLAQQLKVDAFVVGSLTAQDDQISVSVQSVRVKTGKVIAEFTVSGVASDEMRNRLNTRVGPNHLIDSKKLMEEKGEMPKCIRCPSPAYSRAAADAGIHGDVVLSVLIGTDGRAHDIDVTESLPNGLTVEAIKAIKSWVFAPGKSANGKTLEVEIPIQATFK